MSELLKLLQRLGATEQQIEEIIDGKEPKAAAVKRTLMLQQASVPRTDSMFDHDDYDGNTDEMEVRVDGNNAEALAHQLQSDCRIDEIEIDSAQLVELRIATWNAH